MTSLQCQQEGIKVGHLGINATALYYRLSLSLPTHLVCSPSLLSPLARWSWRHLPLVRLLSSPACRHRMIRGTCTPLLSMRNNAGVPLVEKSVRHVDPCTVNSAKALATRYRFRLLIVIASLQPFYCWRVFRCGRKSAGSQLLCHCSLW